MTPHEIMKEICPWIYRFHFDEAADGNPRCRGLLLLDCTSEQDGPRLVYDVSWHTNAEFDAACEAAEDVTRYLLSQSSCTTAGELQVRPNGNWGIIIDLLAGPKDGGRGVGMITLPGHDSPFANILRDPERFCGDWVGVWAPGM